MNINTIPAEKFQNFIPACQIIFELADITWNY